MLCDEKDAKLRVIPMNDRGELILEEYEKLLNPRTKMVAFGHVSNALGTINPAAEIIAMAHKAGALALVDGAQAAPHMKIDVQALDADFYAFSGHKVFGPTGIGMLYGKTKLLNAMPPYQGGGDMIRTVTFEKTTYNDLPYKFEAGTPNIAGGIGLGAALDYVDASRDGQDRGVRARAAGLRDGSAVADSRTAPDRNGAREGGGAFVRHGRHPPARHRHGARPAGHRGPHRAPLRPAGHGLVSHSGYDARFAGAATTRAAEIDALVAGIRKVKEVFS